MAGPTQPGARPIGTGHTRARSAASCGGRSDRMKTGTTRLKGGTVRRLIIGIAALGAVVALGGAAFAGTSARSAGVTLTLWHNYGTEGNAIATKNLVNAFQKLNPNITIKMVSQPA